MQKCGCNSNGIQIGNLKSIDQFLKMDLKKEPWMENYKTSKTGLRIPIVKTDLDLRDRLEHYKARWGINRMNFTIKPGLYGIGNPDENSEVLVTANYKLTFDLVRKELKGLNLWILVLDTKGINVWCAAGKGTFGTDELIERIKVIGLDKIINHKTLILPQLGAVGVSAHQVFEKSGFKVIYGPVLAKDIPIYLKNKKIKTEQMKQMPFKIKDRLVLIPMELVGAKSILLILMGLSILFFLIENKAFQFSFFTSLLVYTLPYLTGAFLTPLLLPFIPFRSLALKGWIMGFLAPLFLYLISSQFSKEIIAAALLLPPFSAFLSLNFTGATTYTSLSGVKKEMRLFIPAMLISSMTGLILKILLLLKIF